MEMIDGILFLVRINNKFKTINSMHHSRLFVIADEQIEQCSTIVGERKPDEHYTLFGPYIYLYFSHFWFKKIFIEKLKK